VARSSLNRPENFRLENVEVAGENEIGTAGAVAPQRISNERGLELVATNDAPGEWCFLEGGESIVEDHLG
jgi:hypothetical protein